MRTQELKEIENKIVEMCENYNQQLTYCESESRAKKQTIMCKDLINGACEVFNAFCEEYDLRCAVKLTTFSRLNGCSLSIRKLQKNTIKLYEE